MHANSGYFEPGLIRRYADVFERYDAVVVPSGSCAGAVRHQHDMIAHATGDEALAKRAQAVAANTYELSEFLIDVLNTDDVGAYFPHRVTYHPTCHSVRMLGVGDRPLRLLRNVRGIELVELPRQEECCGFGGTFSIKNPDVSAAMLADKMEAVIESGAEVLCAGDRSCLMHIGGGLQPDPRRRPDAPPRRDPRQYRRGGTPVSSGELIWSEEGWAGADFPQNAKQAVNDSQLRRNVRKATGTIRERRAGLVAETPDWQQLRRAGAAIKDDVLHHLDGYLEQFERNAIARGAHVHWARDAEEAARTVTDLVQATGHTEVIKVKSMATQEIGLVKSARAGGDRRPRNRSRRDDPPALERQAEPHRGAGAPPQPRRDPPDLSRRHG